MTSVGFYTVKVTSIFFVAIIYFIIGSVLSILLNDIIPDENIEEISTLRLVLILGSIFGSISVIFFVLRGIVKRIPFFLDGYYGFQYSLLREVTGGLIIGYTMYVFLDKLSALMRELEKRIRYERHELLRRTVTI